MKTLFVIAIVAFSEAPGSHLQGSGWNQQPWAAPQYAVGHIRYHGPVALPPGYDKHGAPLPVLDTPEVAHLKSAHQHIYAKTLSNLIAKGLHQPDYTQHQSAGHEAASSWSGAQTHQNAAAHMRYHGPVALPSGYDKHGAPLPVLDTPEVAHAKSAHLSAVAKARGAIHPTVYHTQSESHEGVSSLSGPQTHQYAAAHIRYHGPIAIPAGYDKHGAPLPVLETPEVAHLKAEHQHIYAKTLSNLIAKGLHDPDNTLHKSLGHEGASSWSQPQTHQYAAHIRYNGPIALPSGYDKHGAPLPVIDTPEVAHLKAEHQHEYAKALSNLIAKGLYVPDYSQHQVHHKSW